MKQRGIGLIEIIVTIMMVSFLLAAFTVTFYAIPLGQRNEHTQQAYFLAQQEIEAVKSIPFNDLVNQTNGPFRYIGFPVGSIKVTADAGAYSSPNALQLENVVTAAPFSSLALLPANSFDDFTFSSQVKIKSGAPAGWKIGHVLRYQDKQNYFWLNLDATTLRFNKVINGVSSVLFSQSVTVNTETWYELKTVTLGPSNQTYEIYFNNLLLATISDTDLNSGLLGLALTERTPGQFDDLTVTGSNPGSWNFDSEPVNQLPAQWVRFSLSDLPEGNGTLTIQDYLNDRIKKIIVKVSWKERTLVREITLVTLVTND